LARGHWSWPGDGERRRWPETHGEAKLGARTRGFGAENEYGEDGGARGTIYMGHVGHRRGARRNKGHHQWWLLIHAFGDRKGMGRCWLLKGKMRGGQAAPMLTRRSWPEASGRRLQLLGEEEGEGGFLILYIFLK
jgi:hypothetical protein